MVSATLEFVSSGEIHEDRRSIDINALLQSVQVDQQDVGQVISVTGQASRPISGYARSLKRCVENLVENALRYARDVELIIEEQPGWLLITVRDSGPGIPVAKLLQVMEPFYRLDTSRNSETGGYGLGLSIAQRIAQAMGGTLDCKSQLGRGSTFTLSVRVALAPAQTTSQPATAQAKGAAEDAPRVPQEGAHVLLVEDNPINAIVARANLEQLGLTVSGCENGREALDWLSSHHADLVLMDCLMPEMNGLDATRQIRAREQQAPGSRPLPIIALTASTESRDRMACVEAGMDDVLGKPFTSEELADVIARHLPQRQRRDADSTVLS